MTYKYFAIHKHTSYPKIYDRAAFKNPNKYRLSRLYTGFSRFFQEMQAKIRVYFSTGILYNCFHYYDNRKDNMNKKKSIGILLIFTFLICTLPPSLRSYADSGKYQIKVNRYTNSLTVYEKQADKTYKPVKAMLCSTGGKFTPLGTFRTSSKYRWRSLFYGVYGQYATRITGPILFHSVPYTKMNPSYMQKGEFEKLGTSASHGCIRLSAEDAKWIFDNCESGTSVTIYSSKDPGPLGKPEPVPYENYNGFDPTDIWSKDNPILSYAANTKLSVPKKIVIFVDDYSYDLLENVTATTADGEDITEEVEIEEDIDYSTPGKYQIKYYIADLNGNMIAATSKVVVKNR